MLVEIIFDFICEFDSGDLLYLLDVGIEIVEMCLVLLEFMDFCIFIDKIIFFFRDIFM